MNTTNLIVELIVIGVGASIWVNLLILTLFGYTWIPGKELLGAPALILAPGLAVVYLLGVVTDRLSDSLLGKLWSGKWMEHIYGSNRSQYYRDRALIFHKSERLTELFQYNRTRQRIVRGWILNSIAIAFFLDLFLILRMPFRTYSLRAGVVGTVAFILLSISCWFSWRKLAQIELIQMKEAAEDLRNGSDDTRTNPGLVGSGVEDTFQLR